MILLPAALHPFLPRPSSLLPGLYLMLVLLLPFLPLPYLLLSELPHIFFLLLLYFHLPVELHPEHSSELHLPSFVLQLP